MLQGDHSAILLPFIKLPFVIMTFVLSIFEWVKHIYAHEAKSFKSVHIGLDHKS